MILSAAPNPFVARFDQVCRTIANDSRTDCIIKKFEGRLSPEAMQTRSDALLIPDMTHSWERLLNPQYEMRSNPMDGIARRVAFTRLIQDVQDAQYDGLQKEIPTLHQQLREALSPELQAELDNLLKTSFSSIFKKLWEAVALLKKIGGQPNAHSLYSVNYGDRNGMIDFSQASDFSENYHHPIGLLRLHRDLSILSGEYLSPQMIYDLFRRSRSEMGWREPSHHWLYNWHMLTHVDWGQYQEASVLMVFAKKYKKCDRLSAYLFGRSVLPHHIFEELGWERPLQATGPEIHRKRALERGFSLYDDNQCQKAEKVLLPALLAAGTISHIHLFKMGILYRKIRETRRSLEYFDWSLSLSRRPGTLYQRGITLLYLDEFDRSLASIWDAIAFSDRPNSKYINKLNYVLTLQDQRRRAFIDSQSVAE